MGRLPLRQLPGTTSWAFQKLIPSGLEARTTQVKLGPKDPPIVKILPRSVRRFDFPKETDYPRSAALILKHIGHLSSRDSQRAIGLGVFSLEEDN